MRTTKKQAATVILKLLSAIHADRSGAWEEVPDDLLRAMIAARELAYEYRLGDPRGRKPKADRAAAVRLVGGEQELFRA